MCTKRINCKKCHLNCSRNRVTISSVKKRQKCLFSTERVQYISRFLRLNACVVRCIILKQCVSQQNVANSSEAERVDLQFLFYLNFTYLQKFCNYTRWLKNCGKRRTNFFSKRRIFSKTATVTILKPSPMDSSRKTVSESVVT